MTMIKLLILLTITVTVKAHPTPWAKCKSNVCVVENPLKRPVDFSFYCFAEKFTLTKVSVTVKPQTQDQIVFEPNDLYCSYDDWKDHK